MSTPSRPLSQPPLSNPFDLLGLTPPQAGHSLSLAGEHGSADALFLAAWAQALKQQRQPPLLVVCANAVDASRLVDEMPFFDPSLQVRLLPDWETLPFEPLSPHQDLVSERLSALHSALMGQVDVVVTAASTAIQRLAPPAYLAARTFAFRKGQKVNIDKLREQFVIAGYHAVTQVVSPGEYAIRGGLVDLFPTGALTPYRLDLFDDEIDQLRTFDPDTQRTIMPVDRIEMLPGREFPFDDAARTAFRGRWRETFEGDPSRVSLYKDVGNGIAAAGIEYYLPLFFEETATLFDYLPAQGGRVQSVALLGDIDAALQQFWADLNERHGFLSHDTERPILPPESIYLGREDFFGALASRGRVTLGLSSKHPALSIPAPEVTVDRRAEDPIARLRALHAQKPRVLILAETPGRLETLQQYFHEHQLQIPEIDSWSAFAQSDHHWSMAASPVSRGFQWPKHDWIVLTEAELFTQTARQSRKNRHAQTNVDAIVRDLSELKIGDPVVHSQHGIGRYQGLISMDLGEGATEFLHLVYANQAVLYVPVAQLHVIGRYSGGPSDGAPLHVLGSGQWEKAKRKAAQQARDTAAELLNLYARRASRQGHAFKFDPHSYEAFAEGFGFEETPDQLAAIHATVQDLVSGKPMDRLICGDVGFGKTEVALRAAFVAAMDGKQVAVLAPTTLLAEQHFQTFSDRFSDWPVKLAELSRFRSGKEVQAAIKGIADGTIDIVIGTHKLLSSEVKYQRLGLVIIDEEHRFGVRQKETFKSLRAEVDVLTLTATPIPRTLAMSLEGMRDFSVIATAPSKRLAIKTFVRKEADANIREALLRELKRGGQAYFLHNEVDTIENRRQMLEALVPEARIAVAHGQMPERELERVMREFHQQRFNVLLCTTIIETGIDVPTANTIVMHRADKFGLAQLHQLRGRVGRSHHQAYAYLLIPGEDAVTKDAVKRLEAIQSMEELGSGFYLAMHDLEIRGAGEVLGDSQSGSTQEVGFQLFNDMLNEAVRALKSGREPDLQAPLSATTEINLHIPALLPQDYCADVNERLSLYKRLASCNDQDELSYLQEELLDRFGKMPESAKALIETHRLRLLSTPLGLSKIDVGDESAVLSFGSNATVDPGRIIALMQKDASIRFAGQDRLRITAKAPDLASRVQLVRRVLKALVA